MTTGGKEVRVNIKEGWGERMRSEVKWHCGMKKRGRGWGGECVSKRGVGEAAVCLAQLEFG